MCERNRAKALDLFGEAAEAHRQLIATSPLRSKSLKAIQIVMQVFYRELAAD